MKTRRAAIDDLDSIGMPGRHLGYGPLPEDSLQLKLETLLKSDIHRVGDVEKEGGLCGFMHAFLSGRLVFPDFVEIGAMAVSPAVRRAGAGGLLVHEALVWAQQQACRLRVRCDTRREAASRFYEAAGSPRPRTFA